jgi:hypothetical protein
LACLLANFTLEHVPMALRRLPNEVAQIKLSLEMAKMRPNTTEYHIITIVFVVRSVFSECLVLV